MSEKTTSIEKHSEASATSPGKSSNPERKGRDGMQWFVAGCFVLSTLFWLLALFLFHPYPFWVMQNAFAVLGVCFVIDAILVNQTGLERHLVLSHYALGVIQNIFYITVFNISADLYAAVWTSFFFGYYLFTWVALLTKKGQFFPILRLFFALHHAAAFFVTGTWIIVAPCCYEYDNAYLYRAIVIWLSADVYGNFLNIYRCLRPKADKDMIRKLQTVVFVLERIQNIAAYLQPLTVPASEYNLLMWVCLGTGFLMDSIDTTFQVKSMYKKFQAKKKERRDTQATWLDEPIHRNAVVTVGDVESVIVDGHDGTGKTFVDLDLEE